MDLSPSPALQRTYLLHPHLTMQKLCTRVQGTVICTREEMFQNLVHIRRHAGKEGAAGTQYVSSKQHLLRPRVVAILELFSIAAIT